MSLTKLAFMVPLAGLLALGCGDDDDDNRGAGGTGATGGGGSGGTGGGSAGTGGGSAGTGGGGTGGSDGGVSTAKIRVAHLAPDAPAVDVCVNGGAGFIGPVLKGAGDSDGLAYSEVTSYVELPEGSYTVRIVAPNAANCDTALASLPDITGLALTGGMAYTAAATGMLSPPDAGTKPFKVEAYADTITAANAAKIYVRFIHASPDTPKVDVGLGADAAFVPIWTDVEFPNVGKVGGNDYVETDPITGGTISARASGTTTDALVLTGVNIPAGAVVTAFAIGNLGGSPEPLKALVCVDSAATSTCNVLP